MAQMQTEKPEYPKVVATLGDYRVVVVVDDGAASLWLVLEAASTDAMGAPQWERRYGRGCRLATDTDISDDTEGLLAVLVHGRRS